jgi:hypothetical protein
MLVVVAGGYVAGQLPVEWVRSVLISGIFFSRDRARGSHAVVREDAVVGPVAQPGRRAVGAIQLALDPKRVVVDPTRVVVLLPAVTKPKIARVKKLAPRLTRQPGFAFAVAVRSTQRAETGLGGVAAVGGTGHIIGW